VAVRHMQITRILIREVSQLKVEHYEAQRFLVKSLSNPSNIHLVDLEEYDGAGECSCERWLYNIGPKVKQGKRGGTCRHMRAVRYYLQSLS
jgi:predicted nucleic acid-binding Zn finger protein